MGHHLYDENKRLTRENEALREELKERRAIRDTDVVADAVTAFFKGEAFLEVIPGNVGHIIQFRNSK